jgi:hypothetical protein
MESVYCAVGTESVTVTQVNVGIGELTVNLDRGKCVCVCVCVSLVYETQCCWCDLLLPRIFTPNNI